MMPDWAAIIKATVLLWAPGSASALPVQPHQRDTGAEQLKVARGVAYLKDQRAVQGAARGNHAADGRQVIQFGHLLAQIAPQGISLAGGVGQAERFRREALGAARVH